jgi:hypothetical protein
MSQTRDFDSLARAWLDLMPSEAPDRVVRVVLDVASTTHQVRRPRRLALRGSFDASRAWLAAAAVAIAVALVGGGLAITELRAPTVGQPTPSPIGSRIRPSQAPSLAPTLLPPSITDSTWIAQGGTIPSLGETDARIRLVAGTDGRSLWLLTTANGSPTLLSQSVDVGADQIGLAATDSGSGSSGGCDRGDLGRYRAAVSSDGLILTFRAFGDSCRTREAALSRSWVRALDRNNQGGRGIIDNFSPGDMVELTLPPGSYTVGPGGNPPDSANLEAALTVLRSPVGLSNACGTGPKLTGPSSTAAMLSYLRGLIGVSVQTSAMRIDGHPAVRADVVSRTTPTCPEPLLDLYSPSNPADGTDYSMDRGLSGSLYLVSVDRPCAAAPCVDTYLFQWYGGPGLTTSETDRDMATVHFLAALPTAP